MHIFSKWSTTSIHTEKQFNLFQTSFIWLKGPEYVVTASMIPVFIHFFLDADMKLKVPAIKNFGLVSSSFFILKNVQNNVSPWS